MRSIPRILGQRIAEARKARGKTQEEVAEFLGYSRPTYIAIEKGERPAKTDEILRLAPFLGRTVNELVRPVRAGDGLSAAPAGRRRQVEVRRSRTIAASTPRSTSFNRSPKTIASSSGW